MVSTFALALALGAAPLPAQEIVLDSYAGAGARAMGMGGAFVALSDGFVGLFWNPAGLARTRDGEVFVEFASSRVTNDTRFFGSPSQGRVTGTRFGSMGAVYPYDVHRGSLVLAGGWGRTHRFDGAVRIEGYDDAARFAKSGVSVDRGALGAFVAGGAVDVAANLALGVAVMRWAGSNDFDQSLTFEDTRDAHGDTISLFQRFASDDEIRAWGLRAGLHYTHPSGLRFGLTAASPVAFRVKAALEDEYEDVRLSGADRFPTERFSDRYAVRMPFEFGLGAAWANDRLTLSGDLVYADLQQSRYDDAPLVIGPNVDDFERQYRNTVRLHLGGEVRVPGRPFALRAGYYRDPVRYVGGGSQPAIVVTDERDAWTLGLGGVLENALALDAAVILRRHGLTEGNRDDDVRSVGVVVSVGYRFEGR